MGVGVKLKSLGLDDGRSEGLYDSMSFFCDLRI